MEIATRFTTTPSTVMRSYRACHRLGYLVRWVLSIGLLALGAAQRDVAPAVFGVGFFVFSELTVCRQLKPYLSGPRTVIVTMTDDEYRIEGPDRATTRTWSSFTSVRRTGEFWVLRISNAAAMALPSAALDEKQTIAFRALMREKGLLRGTG